jgi:protein-S-isoprenylcysteine O-methyltransferase Ste14
MYLGILLFFVGTGLWFQSYASVIVVPIAFAPIIARILVEEKTLRETLDGYAAYTERVRYRLVPRIW